MSESAPALKAPFPYFGGKSKIAPLVWSRFGRVKHYIEPFAGSLAVLLGAPEPARLEVIGDADHNVANFWRAVAYQPDQVAFWADQPVVHVELTARHRWLCDPERVQRLRERLLDPTWPGDARIAGWWVWGLSSWIGSGWCSKPHKEQIPRITSAGQGVSRASMRDQIPHLGNAGRGLSRASMRDQIPHISDAGQGVGKRAPVLDTLRTLSERLRHVRVVNGDWSRCTNLNHGTKQNGTAGVFLDPPYRAYEKLYPQAGEVADAVEAWAKETAEHPRVRIALCGHAGDYDLPGWNVVPWSRRGKTYSSDKTRNAECVWFSPACLHPQE